MICTPTYERQALPEKMTNFISYQIIICPLHSKEAELDSASFE